MSFDTAKHFLQEHGFQLQASHPAYAVFRKFGTENPWTRPVPDVGNVPLERALARSYSGLHIQLR